MRIDYSDRALSDLVDIHDYLKRKWPGVGEKFDARLHEIERTILTFPNGSVTVKNRPGVFVIPFVRLPYRLFYKVEGGVAMVLHIRNTSRAG